jgi:hypothetical protein
MTDYLEGAMDAALRERFEHHLADCEGCTNYLDQVRHTVATAGRLAANEVPTPLRDRLREAFRGWQADGA